MIDRSGVNLNDFARELRGRESHTQQNLDNLNYACLTALPAICIK